jgi:hypothetical protein
MRRTAAKLLFLLDVRQFHLQTPAADTMTFAAMRCRAGPID